MIWADFLNRGDAQLGDLLKQGRTLLHAYVRGELSLGNLPRREAVLADLDVIPQPPLVDHDEVCDLIENNSLFGTGIGYVDAHLIASTILVFRAKLWTRDKRLKVVADRLGIASELA